MRNMICLAILIFSMGSNASPIPPRIPHGVPGKFTTLIDATFGTERIDATVKSRSDLDKLAYYWYEYGDSASDPSYWVANVASAPNNCHGPSGAGTDGLYGNYVARHLHCDPGSPWDRHVLGPQHLTLKSNCGLTDGNKANCTAPNIGSGMLRFIAPLRPTSGHPIVVELRGIMPKGMYSWPAFWLNPGQQNPRNADGSPGSLISSAWPPEIDVFDQFGFNNTLPGHYLISASPTGGNDAAYASNLCQSQGLSICDLPLTPGGLNLPTTTVASFAQSGWYATTTADLTTAWHTYGAVIYTDHFDDYLDGVKYRSRGFTWPASSPPMQLLVSNQTGAYFNDLSGLKDQGGVPNGWDWPIRYIRAWQQN